MPFVCLEYSKKHKMSSSRAPGGGEGGGRKRRIVCQLLRMGDEGELFGVRSLLEPGLQLRGRTSVFRAPNSLQCKGRMGAGKFCAAGQLAAVLAHAAGQIGRDPGIERIAAAARCV